MKLRTAALVLALAWPGLALGQAHPGVGTPNFASMSTDGAIAAGGLLSGATLGITGGGSLAGTFIGSPNFNALSVGGTGPITGFGTGIGQALGPLTSRGGFPSLELNGRLIINQAAPNVSNFADVHFRHDGTSVVGGTSATINKTIMVDQTIGSLDGNQNWAMTSSLHSNSTVGGIGVAGYSQSVRNAGSNAWMWGFISEMTDQTGLSSSAVGNPSLSQENDLSTTGVDDAVNPAKFGGFGNRHLTHYVVDRYTGSANNEVTHGLWFGTNHSYIDSLIGFDIGGIGGAQVRQVLDTRGAVPPTGVTDPVAAVRMSAGHIIDFNGGAALTSAPGRYLTYNSGATKLQYLNAGTEVFSISDIGGGVLASGLQVGGQITSARSNAVGATAVNIFGTQYNLDNANATPGSITNYYAMQCNSLTGGGAEPTNKFCLRNTDANSGIVTAGNVSIGSLSPPAANVQLAIQGPDTSGSTFPLSIKALGGANLLSVADSGSLTMEGPIQVGIAGSVVGTISFVNATSGNIKLSPPAGALGTPVLTMPAVSDTLAVLGTSQTHTAVQTFSGTLNASGVLQGNGVAGVTCAPGAPTALFSASNGIVTHC